MSDYYLLYPTTMNPCTLEKRFYEEARRAGLCPECGFLRPGTTVIDVIIQEEKPDDTPLNGITGTGLGLAKKEFLRLLGDEIVKGHLQLGKVYGPYGRVLDEWATFLGIYQVIVRGSKHVRLRRCASCGRNLYFALGQRYLYPAPPQGVLLMDGGDGLMVVADELLQELRLDVWPKVECVKLPVLEVPKDGLVDLRSVY